MKNSIKLPALLALSACSLLLGACGNKEGAAPDKPASASAAAASNPYQPTMAFQEIMDAVVDASADYIWSGVSTIVDEKGVHENRPRTDEEWHEFRRRAVVLAEAANLLSVPGRKVTTNGSDKTIETHDPLPVEKIQERLDTKHDALVGFAGGLRQVSLQMIDAIDKKDLDKIVELGGELDQACENCHLVFWYPEDAAAAAAAASTSSK